MNKQIHFSFILAAALTQLTVPHLAKAQVVITKEPDDQTILYGQDATYTVEVTGTPPLSYQWRDYTSFTQFSDIEGATNDTLVLIRPEPSNHRYRVVVSNNEGEVLSRLARLTVLVPATISIPPANRTVIAGQSARFSVTATSPTQPLHYQWQMNGQNMLGQTKPELILDNVQVSQAGRYSVTVSNAAGLVTSKHARLTVLPATFDHFIPINIAHDSESLTPAVKLSWRTTPGKSYGLLSNTDLQDPLTPHPGTPVRAESTITSFVQAADSDLEVYQAFEEAAPTGNTGVITEASVAEFEKIVGLTFESSERTLMLANLANDGAIISRASFEAIRAIKYEPQDAMSLVFDPRPAGFVLPEEQSPVNWGSAPLVSRPDNLEELAFYTVRELSELIRQRLVTSTELTELCLARLKQHDPVLKCVINLTEDLAREQAARADAEIASGIYRGPLHGIPYGIKDLFSARNYPTTWGSAVFEDQIMNEDATVVRKLEESGAVLVAKLSMGELAFGAVWFGGTTRNPWNTNQDSSGSSAGPASATAAGLVPFAIGTETLGSIISPCTRCRVTGLRPTFGLVSRKGAMPLSWSMDKVGPIARTVEDCALVFDVIRGTDEIDRSVVSAPFNYDAQRDLTNLRIGYRPGLSQSTLNQLSSLVGGAELVPIELPVYPTLPMLNIMFAEAATAFDELTRFGGDDFLIDQSSGGWANSFRSARAIPAVEYLLSDRLRGKLIQEMAQVMSEIDLYVAPNGDGDTLFITNYTGHPCAVIPNGGATSLCFIGRLYDEGTLVAFAKAYQEAAGFHLEHPPAFLP